MFSSKILTLDKVDIIESLLSGCEISSRDDYFNLGYPMLNPPSLRGSIILCLHDRFLEDNLKYFIYGSPIDIGSIRFNFIKNAEEIIESSKCNYQKFNRIVGLLNKLPSQYYQSFINHERSNATLEIIDKEFDQKVGSIIRNSYDPHSWIFEFCLGRGYALKKHHIKYISIPNTYKNSEPFKSLINYDEIALKFYNPKYGIESAAR